MYVYGILQLLTDTRTVLTQERRHVRDLAKE